MSLFSIYFQMLFDPNGAFAKALSKKIWTLVVPLSLAIILTASVNVYYFHNVDLPWLTDQMTTGLTVEQREATVPLLTRDRLLGITLFGVVFLALVINLARAFLIWIILKVRGGETQRFMRVFAIVMWSTAPLLLILPAGILNISLAPEGRIVGNDVNPVSINQLLFHLPAASGWGQMLSTFSLINLWEILLIAVGLQFMAKLKFTQAALIAATPDLIAYGLWSAALLIGSES